MKMTTLMIVGSDERQGVGTNVSEGDSMSGEYTLFSGD